MQNPKLLTKIGSGIIILIGETLSYFSIVISFQIKHTLPAWQFFMVIFVVVIYLLGLFCVFLGSNLLKIKRKWMKRVALGTFLFGIFWGPFIHPTWLALFILFPFSLFISVIFDWRETLKNQVYVQK